MNRFFALLLASSCLTAVGQVTYPYNPDEDGNGQIAVGDLQGILATYGNEFSPSEILVDGETLTTVLTQLQNSIDSLSGLGGSGGSVLDMPLGTILPIATESVPEGWMLCDGREISIEEYQELYDLIGTTYGAGDSAFWAQVFFPATTFNIPDLRGRTIIGANDMGGEQSDVLTIHQASAGQVGGEELHQLSEDEMPSHGHGLTGNGIAQTTTSYWDTFHSVVTSGSGMTGPAGGDQPHNNMQPYMALNYMMKVQAAQDVFAQLQATIDSLMGSSNDSTLQFVPCEPSDFYVVVSDTIWPSELDCGCGGGQNDGFCTDDGIDSWNLGEYLDDLFISGNENVGGHVRHVITFDETCNSVDYQRFDDVFEELGLFIYAEENEPYGYFAEDVCLILPEVSNNFIVETIGRQQWFPAPKQGLVNSAVSNYDGAFVQGCQEGMHVLISNPIFVQYLLYTDDYQGPEAPSVEYRTVGQFGDGIWSVSQ